MFHLVFENITIKKDSTPDDIICDDKSETIFNDPRNDCHFRIFQNIIYDSLDQINIVKKSAIVEKAPLFNFNENKDIKFLPDIHEVGLEFEKENTKYKPIEKKSTYYLCSKPNESTCDAKRVDISTRGDDSEQGAEFEEQTSVSRSPGDSGVIINADLRSVQGIIYYLGEMLRAQEASFTDVDIE